MTLSKLQISFDVINLNKDGHDDILYIEAATLLSFVCYTK